MVRLGLGLKKWEENSLKDYKPFIEILEYFQTMFQKTDLTNFWWVSSWGKRK